MREICHFWSADVSQVKAGDRYRIVLSSHWNDCYHTEGAELIRRDPYAREVDFDTPWCILTTPSFDWGKFNPPAYNELIIYELHIGSFPPQIDGKSAFELISEGLPYIRELGFNCLQFMPVTEFGLLHPVMVRTLTSLPELIYSILRKSMQKRQQVDTCSHFFCKSAWT